jgi:hypothetical protein
MGAGRARGELEKERIRVRESERERARERERERARERPLAPRGVGGDGGAACARRTAAALAYTSDSCPSPRSPVAEPYIMHTYIYNIYVLFIYIYIRLMRVRRLIALVRLVSGLCRLIVLVGLDSEILRFVR